MHVSHMHTHWHLVRLLFTYSDTTLLDPVTLMLLVGILHPFRKASSIRVTLDHPDKLSVDNEVQLLRKYCPTCVTLFHPEMSSVVNEMQLARKYPRITVTLFHPEMSSVGILTSKTQNREGLRRSRQQISMRVLRRTPHKKPTTLLGKDF